MIKEKNSLSRSLSIGMNEPLRYRTDVCLLDDITHGVRLILREQTATITHVRQYQPD